MRAAMNLDPPPGGPTPIANVSEARTPFHPPKILKGEVAHAGRGLDLPRR